MLLRGVVLGIFASLVAAQAITRDSRPFIYTAAPRYEPQAWEQGAERFPDGAHLVLVTPEGRHELTPSFFAAADASVSSDGRRILFAARPAPSDPWQIWEMDLAGGTPNRVAAGADSLVRPLYLPGGKIAYARLTRGGAQIEVLTSNGAQSDVLTHAPGWFLPDEVLRDGRILFEWLGDLFTVYSDGTGVESLRCDHGPHRAGGRQVISGDVIFAVDGVLARFTSALARQQPLSFPSPRSPAPGPQSPAPGSRALTIVGPVAETAPGQWLVAARPRTGGTYSIYRTDSGLGIMERVEAPQHLNAVQPVVVAIRVPPPDFPSALVPTRKTGNLLCLDARESKDAIAGKVHSIRLYTRDSSGRSQCLGQTTVASDGSFYVEVPADRPIRMELLDPAGVRLRGEEHWFWMRPSEQRVCVGCHAGPERAPENRVPEILNETTTPVQMLGETGRPR